MRLALYPWSKSIKGSIERIAELASGDGIRIDVCKEAPKWSKYDGAILNNDFRPLPVPRVTYLTGLAVRRALAKPSYTKGRLKLGDHRGVLTNSNTAVLALKKKGIKAMCLYRPYPVHIERKPPPLPKEHRILWYWKPGWAYCESLDQDILKAMLQVARSNIEIWVISNKHAPVEGLPKHANIRALGRCDFSSILPQVRGMVRLTGDFDWGRSNFDVVCSGRWTLNLNAWEFEAPDGLFSVPGPGGVHRCNMLSARTIAEAVKLVVPLVRQGHDIDVIHGYASSRFREEKVRANWQKQLKKRFS
ncbi:MAG: hypothetical protein ACO4AU_15360 [bacterium]|jgi:hypothetical protein